MTSCLFLCFLCHLIFQKSSIQFSFILFLSDNLVTKWLQYRYDETSLTIYLHCTPTQLQTHTCSLPQDHMPGLDCLSDEQVLPLLLTMDSETLLQVGKSSPRLYSLVCDRQVWRHLLKEVDDLDQEQVEELVDFWLGPNCDIKLCSYGLFGIRGSLGMMSEVLREAARRFVFLTGAVKLTIAIPSYWEGRDDFEVFEVDCAYLDELISVAASVGLLTNQKSFIIKGMQTPLVDYCIDNIDNIDMALVGRVMVSWIDMLAPLRDFYISFSRDNLFKICKDQRRYEVIRMSEMVKTARNKALHLLLRLSQ